MNETKKKMAETKTFTIVTPFARAYNKTDEIITRFKVLEKWRDEIADGEVWMQDNTKTRWIVYPLNLVFAVPDLRPENLLRVPEKVPEGVIDKLYFPTPETRQEFYDFLSDELFEYREILGRCVAVCDEENGLTKNWTLFASDDISDETGWNDFSWTMKQSPSM